MNKIEIIQKLLDERHITAAEAMELLKTEKEYIYQYWPNTYPAYPATPIYPTWTINPDGTLVYSYPQESTGVAYSGGNINSFTTKI